MISLRISVEPAGGLVLVRATGSLRRDDADGLATQIDPVLLLRPPVALFDLRALDAVDRRGGTALAGALRRLPRVVNLLPSEETPPGQGLAEALRGLRCYHTAEALREAEGIELPMPPEAERRRAVRQKVRLNAEVVVARGQTRAGWTVDLSRVGAQVCTREPLPDRGGQPVALRLSMTTVPVRVARVLSGDELPTWGLEFLGPIGQIESLLAGIGA